MGVVSSVVVMVIQSQELSPAHITVKHGGPAGRYSGYSILPGPGITTLRDKYVQIAPSLEEGTGAREHTEAASHSTSGRLKEEQKQAQSRSVLSPPKALPKQTKAKCSLGFCRANQVMIWILKKTFLTCWCGRDLTSLATVST